MISLIIDDMEVTARPGEKILWAALRAGIAIPHLCAMPEDELAFGACRLCLVEVERAGNQVLVTACSEPAREGMKIITASDKIKRLRRMAFELIMSDHQIDCKNCAKNKECRLIRIAKLLKVKLKPERLRGIYRPLPADYSHPFFVYDPKKCVKCGKCVLTCERQGKSFLTFAHRGFDMIVSTFDATPLSATGCESHFECVDVCPTGALFHKKEGGKKQDGQEILYPEGN